MGMGRMAGKFPAWWEKSRRGIGKTAGKNSGMVGNFPQGERKNVFQCMEILVLRHPSHRLHGIFLFLLYQCRLVFSFLAQET